MDSKEIKKLVDKYILRFNNIKGIPNILMSDDLRRSLDLGIITDEMCNSKSIYRELKGSMVNTLEPNKAPYFLPLSSEDFIYWNEKLGNKKDFTIDQYIRYSAFKFDGIQLYDQEKSVNWNLALNNSFMVSKHNEKVSKIIEQIGGKTELSMRDLEDERARYKKEFVSILKDFIVESSNYELDRETFAYEKDYKVLDLFHDKNNDSLNVLLQNKIKLMTSNQRNFTSLSETRLRKILRLFLNDLDNQIEELKEKY